MKQTISDLLDEIHDLEDLILGIQIRIDRKRIAIEEILSSHQPKSVQPVEPSSNGHAVPQIRGEHTGSTFIGRLVQFVETTDKEFSLRDFHQFMLDNYPQEDQKKIRQNSNQIIYLAIKAKRIKRVTRGRYQKV